MILSILFFIGVTVIGALAVGTMPDPASERREEEIRKHYLDTIYN